MEILDKDYFLGTLVVGMLVVYLILPTPDIILKTNYKNTLIDIKETDCDI